MPDDVSLACTIDLDDCRNPETGVIADWAVDIIQTLNSYSEVSPSGTGVKIIVKGAKNTNRCRAAVADTGGEIEIYDQGRYFTITSQRVDGTPETVEERQQQLDDICCKFLPVVTLKVTTKATERQINTLTDEEIINLCSKAQNHEKFKALMAGDFLGYPSQSEADAALMCIFAFYSGDPKQLERLFSKSCLANRDKWQKREDYKQRLVDGAISATSEYPAGGIVLIGEMACR